MPEFRFVHTYHPGVGWGFRCDERRIGGGSEHRPHDGLAGSRREAEAVAWFVLEGDAEELGQPLPRPEDVRIMHVLETPAAVSAPAA
ncbi:hypothetical protein Q5424_28910 [Conexibacter sp. JD483]|uniref:hypothetical protein n=1 Tax=unclassified Conexibacter TaxID=2627773 RepID=UPI002725CC2A|nr:MULTISPECIES: hypothetical protein [unclassified Conexibacter]MDO8187174.1 hypothetical protein [Conexibacter sp. CPCC 205706]MDO8200350.1 hypothetical protein [Conexibacter sp. CPCC 205762]MDR9373154.1 hypothetical protein [Conexibacter sp. JD483]